MKRRTIAVLIAAVAASLPLGVGLAASDPVPDDTVADTDPDVGVEIVIFHGEGCPHCARMLVFLDDLEERTPDLSVTRYEVWNDRANQELFRTTMAALGEEASSVPTTLVGDRVYIGYSDAIADRIETVVAELSAGRAPDDADDYVIDVPFVGTVNVGSRSLVGATVLIAFVDGVNPCSLWVLSMLMALVVHSGSRSRVFAVGTVFLVITSALYGLYMLGAYSTLAIVGRQAWIRAAVALIAGVFGVLHLKEHWTTAGPSVTIAAEHKPGIFRRMRQLADPDRSLPATLGGTALLAVGVSLLETPCTAGLPLLWTDLLSARDVPASGAAFLFAVYLLVFLLDELLIFGAVVVTMRATKMQEHHGEALQLIGGTLMLTLAIVMLFASHLLESVGGTAIVFGSAAAVSATVLAVEWWWRHHARRPTGPNSSGGAHA